MRFVGRSFVGEPRYVGNIAEQSGLVSTSSGPARESVYEPRSRSDYRRGRRRSQWYCNLSQVGAQFGFAMLWTMLFPFPLMAAIQEICARLGRITGIGVAANLAKCYPKTVAPGLVLLLCVANVFNLGADVAAMAAAIQLLVGGNLLLYASFFGAASFLLQVYVPYRIYVCYLKWLTWALFAYVSTAFVVRVPWTQALRSTLIPSDPSVSVDPEYLMALIAVLGTTISPYLFFWQTSQEVEDVRINKHESPLRKKPSQAFAQFRRIAFGTRVGMAFSNSVAFFIILTTAATLHASYAGLHIQTAADAAKALRPLAGRFAALLFALGIIGTGMLAIPVLAGSRTQFRNCLAGGRVWRASRGTRVSFTTFFLPLRFLGVLEFCGDEPYPRAIFIGGGQRGCCCPRDVPVDAGAQKTGDCWQVRSPAISARGGVGRNRRHAGGVTWFSGDNGAAIVGALMLFAFPAILPYLLGAAAFTRCGLPTGGLCIS